MKEELKNESKPIPYSGRIIGAIVDALDITDEGLIDKTAKRYYSGKNISEYSLNRIHSTLGEQLVKLNIIPIPQMFEKHDLSMPNITTASLIRLAKKWDGLVARIQSRSGKLQDYNQAAEVFSSISKEIIFPSFILGQSKGILGIRTIFSSFSASGAHEMYVNITTSLCVIKPKSFADISLHAIN